MAILTVIDRLLDVSYSSHMSSTKNNPQTTPLEFGSEEAIASTKRQIKNFVAHTNNDAVIRELELALKTGRNQVGWKHTGRLFLEAIQESAFVK